MSVFMTQAIVEPLVDVKSLTSELFDASHAADNGRWEEFDIIEVAIAKARQFKDSSEFKKLSPDQQTPIIYLLGKTVPLYDEKRQQYETDPTSKTRDFAVGGARKRTRAVNNAIAGHARGMRLSAYQKIVSEADAFFQDNAQYLPEPARKEFSELLGRAKREPDKYDAAYRR